MKNKVSALCEVEVHGVTILLQENATPKITAKQIQLKQPCFKKGSLAAVSHDLQTTITNS